MINDWFKKLLNVHGERFVFGGMALLFSVAFIFEGSEEFSGAGKAIAIGLAMLCFNKARGSNNGNKE